MRYVRGDLDGAVAAMDHPAHFWSRDALAGFEDYNAISTILVGLLGPNKARIAPLYRKYAAGDWAACAAEADAVWDNCEDITPFEASLLATAAAEAWVHVGHPAGEPRFFGVLRRRQFTDWINYSSGLALEEGTDNGSGHSRDGDAHWMRLVYAVPAALSVAGSFEPWGAPDAPHVLCVQLAGAKNRHAPATRLVAFLREKERVGAAVVADPRNWTTPVEPAVWRRLPEGWPVRFRVVSSAGRLLVFLGDEERPVLDAPLATDGAAPPDGPLGLWIGHRNARFFGVTLRKPDADEAALAAESAANAEAAEKKPHAEGAEDDSHAEGAESAEEESHAEIAGNAETDTHAESVAWRPTPEQTGRFRFQDRVRVIVVEVNAEGRFRHGEDVPDSPPILLRPAKIKGRDLVVAEMVDTPYAGRRWTLAMDFDAEKRAWIVVGEGETVADIDLDEPGYKPATFLRVDEPPSAHEHAKSAENAEP